MLNFYVKEGKKLIDYKPKRIHYSRALKRLAESMVKYIDSSDTMFELKRKHEDDFFKMLYLSIKLCGLEDYKILDGDEIEDEFQRIMIIEEMVGLMTPREFMRMFPIEKDYDGEKYQVKDYFYCIDYINEFGIDNHIGSNASDFLMEYWNWDVNEYMVYCMGLVNRMYKLHGGRDVLLELFESHGITPHTFHSDGEYMIDDETGQ